MAASLVTAFDVISVMLSPKQQNAGRLYTALGSTNNLAEETLFLNLGFWEHAIDYDSACRALAYELGRAANLSETDEVLDVGFGFGDPAFYWIDQFKPHHIVGLNITPLQVNKARKRANDAGLSDRIDFRLGSATNMPVKDFQFDKVLALETAFHFTTRDHFFREAYRALRPGGRLALADIIPRQAAQSIRQRTAEHFACAFWQIPASNMVSADRYRDQLATAGFKNIGFRSIADKVYKPFVRYARKRLRNAEVIKRMNPLVRWIWQASVRDENAWDSLDYVIVTAEKPHA
jgi:ubiquinone/menaquinone biosynthesis C-methylase UbiE